MISGFGLENIGKAALKFPKIATLLVIIASLYAAIGVTRLGFSGDTVEVLKDSSTEYQDYARLLKEFRDFNQDAVILIRSPSLNTVDGFETFRDIHFELQLDETIDSVLSVFSLLQYKADTNQWSSLVPASFDSDEELRSFLTEMVEKMPVSQGLISPTLDSAVIVIYPNAESIRDETVRQTVAHLKTVTSEFEADGIDASVSGLPAIRADLVQSIIDDQILLGPLGILACALIALFVFRHWLPAILCTLPPALAVLWLLGSMGHAGIKLNFLTSILPILIIVVIFADSLHLFFKWRRLSSDGQNPVAAIVEAVKTVGPACAVASITTAMALGSFLLSDNAGLIELGTMGALGILGGFFAVIVVLPLACHWTGRFGWSMGPSSGKEMRSLARPAVFLAKHPFKTVFIGLILTAVGFTAHINIESKFRLLDYLPTASDVRANEQFIEERYAGTTPYFAIVDIDRSAGLLSEKNVSAVFKTQDIFKNSFEATAVYSLVTLGETLAERGTGFSESDLDEIPDYLKRRFISDDKEEVLITAFAAASNSASRIQDVIDDLNGKAAAAGIGDRVVFTGYPVLVGTVAPRLMDRLRQGLLIAALLSIVIIGAAARSWRLGLACIVPNLLPILTVEILLWALTIPLDLTITVALTVAFGIAVDDSIHLVNHYLQEREKHGQDKAIALSVAEVVPALVATTLVLCTGLAVTIFSALPTVSLFGLVVVVTLVMALVADIFQLPSYLLLLDKNKKSR